MTPALFVKLKSTGILRKVRIIKMTQIQMIFNAGCRGVY